ncbi:hypothetical protein, partial [Vibrio sp. 10N.222.49.C9]|uniref:hypothetical protein n=1 Tax=Vibrio sp. 10N.222.49.C9 TaxID=3229615 RepID=UPI0035542B5B
ALITRLNPVLPFIDHLFFLSCCAFSFIDLTLKQFWLKGSTSSAILATLILPPSLEEPWAPNINWDNHKYVFWSYTDTNSFTLSFESIG